MSTNLFGTVVVDRQMASDDVWLCEPFSRGQAWMDLTLLANDEPRTIRARGVEVRLVKGQVGRSVINLAERWQWSREKTHAFLKSLQDMRKITFRPDSVATVITVIDYSVYNREKVHDRMAEPAANPNPEPTAEPTAEPNQNKGTGEQGNKNKGTGEGPIPKNYVPVEQAVGVLTSNGSDYDAAEIQAAWHELTAGAVDGNWVTGRPLRPIANWQSALMSEVSKQRRIYGVKKPMRGAGAGAADGEPPAPAGVPRVTLKAMRDAVD